MTTERWIVIPGWDKFQHRDGFRQRVPTWIKDYTEQTDKDAYLDLTFPQRGLLADIRREYAKCRQSLRGDTPSLTRRLGQKVREDSLQALVHAGYIAFSASDPASQSASDVASHYASTEERREEKNRTSNGSNASLDVGKPTPDEDPKTDLARHAQATLKQLAGAQPAPDPNDDIPF